MLLDPHTRRTFLDALRPPPGCKVDSVIGTTYSLDLTALLTAPLAFSLFDGVAARSGQAGDGDAGIDPLALLQAVRAHAEKITIFCQSTRIHSPASYRPLVAYLEESVWQVEARHEAGVFHPKVWALRFVADDGAVSYRVLCATRNLTFDRSWDTLLVLDGELADRTNAIAINRPLADFFAALPGLGRPPPKRVKGAVERVADELLRVKFDLPSGFDQLAFLPLGIDGYAKFPFEGRIQRLLVVSPFVSDTALARLTQQGHDHWLVSRADELEAANPAVLAKFTQVRVLHDAIEQDDDDATVEAPVQPGLPPSTGLHAKLYIADDGWDAHVWTGSANATEAAFERNVEFLVKLTGKKSVVGIDKTLENGGLEMLLAGYAPRPDRAPESEVAKRLEERVRRLRARIGKTIWCAIVGAGDGASFPFSLHTRGKGLMLEAGEHARVHPITLNGSEAKALSSAAAGVAADFGTRSFEAITSFFSFHVGATEGDDVYEESFALNVPLEGAPADRGARILHQVLGDPAKVMRFLRILLADDPLDLLDAIGELEGQPSTQQASASPASPEALLFETLLRALHRDPTRIDAVDRVVQELSSTKEGMASLTQPFLDIWEPIREARASLGKRGRQ